METSPLRVLHTIPDLNKITGGGSRRFAVQLCETLGASGAIVRIVSQEEPCSTTCGLTPDSRYVHTHSVKLIVSSERLHIKYSPYFEKIATELCRQEKIKIIHDHGIWQPSNHASARIARHLGIPLVIHPHGMVQPWAMEHRAWKKRLAWLFYQRQDMESAAVLVAASSFEAEAIRKAGLLQPIAVIPMGVRMPVRLERFITQEKVHNALFLSRINPSKGLLNLVTAWAQFRPKRWRMIVAGPDEEHHLRDVKLAVQRAQLEEDFKFVGMVEGTDKEKLYREADLFILPTLSENFAIVVAEALSYGVPVITTYGAPWQDLITNRCGWRVEVGPEPLVDAIREATSLSDAERYDMGERGRSFVENTFAWKLVAKQTLDVYRWIRGIIPKPDVVLD